MKFSIRSKLIAFILIPVAAIYAMMMLFNMQALEERVVDRAKEKLSYTVMDYAEKFDSHFREVAQIARSTASFIEVDPNMTKNEIYKLLRNNIQEHPLVYGSAMAFEEYQYDPETRLVSPYVYEGKDGFVEMDIGIESYDYTRPEWEWWNHPKGSGRDLWTEPYFDEGAGNILMGTYSAPFYQDGKFWGVTTIDIPLEKLLDLVDLEVEEDVVVSIVSGSGHYVYSPNSEIILKETIHSFLTKQNREDFLEHADAIVEGQVGSARIRAAQGDEFVFLFYAPIQSARWTLIAEMPEAKVLAIVKERIARELCVLIVALIFNCIKYLVRFCAFNQADLSIRSSCYGNCEW